MHKSELRERGQSLAEFALVVPILMVVVGAIIQFGIIFWAQNTLTQVVRDTGRWEATQKTSPNCRAGGAALIAKADSIAQISSLFGYAAGQWRNDPTILKTYLSEAEFNAAPALREGLDVAWPISTDESGLTENDCPPTTNQDAWFVDIRAHHVVPVFFPGIGGLIPGCDASGCSLSSSVQFRMEPAR